MPNPQGRGILSHEIRYRANADCTDAYERSGGALASYGDPLRGPVHCTMRFVRTLLGTMLVMTAAASVGAEVTIRQVTYAGWAGSFRLSNGTTEVVVVPKVGRLMRYGFIGGPNLIWEDPSLAGKPTDSKTFPRFGGSKAWPWPQHEWPSYIGHEWPPPPAADQAPFTATRVGSDTIRMESALVVGFGVTVVREVKLASMGSQVTITTRLKHVATPGPTKTLAAWSITPAAAPDRLLVRMTPGSSLAKRYKPLGAFAPFASVTVKDYFMQVVRHPNKSSKIGIEGDTIGAVYGDTIWILRDRTREPEGEYSPGERVQLYANADSREDTARGLPPYMEFEFTSPRKPLSRSGETVTLTEVWELKKMPLKTEAKDRFLMESLRRP